MNARFTFLLTACVTLAACAAPVVPVATSPAGAATPLEKLLGYRLQQTKMAPQTGVAISVKGVAPPVSAMTPGGDRFMVRPDTHEVLRLDAAGGLAVMGGLGGEAGRLNQPSSLSASANAIYVADTQNHRIQAFDREGKPLAEWGGFGLTSGQFMQPRAVEVLKGGVVAVTDDFRVQYFEADGRYLTSIPIDMAAGAKEAEAARSARESEASATASQEAQAIMDEMRDIIREIREKLAEIEKAQNESARTIAQAGPDARQLVQDGFAAQADRLALQPSGQFAAAVLAAAVQKLAAEELAGPSRKVAGLGAPTGDMVQPIGGVGIKGGGVRPVGGGTGDGAAALEAFRKSQEGRVGLTDAELESLLKSAKSSDDLKRLEELIRERNEAFDRMMEMLKKLQETQSQIVSSMR